MKDPSKPTLREFREFHEPLLQKQFQSAQRILGDPRLRVKFDRENQSWKTR